MLTGLAALITAISGLIGSIGGLIGVLVVWRRTSSRERDDAARSAVHRALAPPTQIEAEQDALIELNKARPQRRKGRRRDRD